MKKWWLSPLSLSIILSSKDYGKAVLEAVPASFAGPIGGKIARYVGASNLLGNSVGVGVGTFAYNEATRNTTGASQTNIAFNSALTSVTNYGAGKIIGNIPGVDVRSIFSPNFYVGKHTQNELSSGLTSQALFSASPSLDSVVSGVGKIINGLKDFLFGSDKDKKK